MASIVVSASPQQPTRGGLSLFSSSDQEILNQIYATYVHHDETSDIGSLFIVVENIIKRSTQIADSVVLGTHAIVGNLEEKTPKLSFNPPLRTLKHISCEVILVFDKKEFTRFRTYEGPEEKNRTRLPGFMSEDFGRGRIIRKDRQKDS